VKLKISKDRQGGVGARGTIPYEVSFEPAGNGTTTVKFKPQDAASPNDWKPTAIMEKIVAHLRLYTTDTKSAIAAAIGSKRATVFKAIECLAAEGRISVVSSGQSHVIKLAEGFKNEA